MANVFRPHEVSLFDEFYPIMGPVQPRNAAQFAEKITFGDVGKDSEQIRSSWIISDQRGGIGVKDMDERRDADRVWWSTSWISTKGHLTLPILATDATNPTGADATALIEYNNQMYAVFGKDLRRRIEGSNSWSSTLGTLAAVPTDALVHKSKLYFACGDDFNRYDGTTLTTSAQPCRYLVEWDDKLYMLDNTGQMDFTMDEGVTFVTDALSILPSGSFTSLFKYRDAGGAVIIYLGTKEGLYAHDNGQTSWVETRLPLPYHDFNCRGAAWWRQWAFISSGMAVYQLEATSGEITPMGLDRDQGVPQEYAGNIVKLLAGHNFLYALIDATSTVARDIFGAVQGGGEFGGGGLWNGVMPANTGFSYVARWDGYGWSVVALSTSADTAILTGALATAEDEYRIWYGMNNTVHYVPLPTTLDNPVLVSTSKFAASSVHISPWFDHDNEVETKLAAELTGFYEDMSDDEYITLEYGLDGDDDTWTLMTNSSFPDGQIDQNGEFIFEFADGAGVAFKSMRFRESLYRGSTNTNAPDRRWLRLSYVPLLVPKWAFSVRVDCRRNYRFRKARALANGLEAALASQTMGNFNFMNQGASENHRVRLVDMPGAVIGGRRKEGVYDLSLVAP
tara:strand:+ start:310 stop:2175 length:1866 start_codon:yes stop_codon:yes gene_type:complete